MSRAVATFFGAGFLRPASGTWASAITVALAVAAYQAGWALAVPAGAALAVVAGFLAVPAYLRATGGEDPSEVVIDEVAGQWLTLLFVPPHPLLYLAGFLLFRLADILKPWPVGWADRAVKGSLGVMLDDILAALYAGAALLLLAWWTGA